MECTINFEDSRDISALMWNLKRNKLMRNKIFKNIKLNARNYLFAWTMFITIRSLHNYGEDVDYYNVSLLSYKRR